MNANTFNTAFTTTHAVLSGNLVDPLSRGSKWIYAANPRLGSVTAPDLRYPIIVIEPYSQGDSSPETFGTYIMDNTINSTIEIHDNVGGSRFDALCGQFVNAFRSNLPEFAKSGMRLARLTPGLYDSIYFSRDNRLHIKSFGVEFVTK
jgi:hypothetical protein